MKEFLKDWKVHALCGVMVLAAELIGLKSFAFGPISFSMYPMLYTIIMGVLLAVFKAIPKSMMETASPYITISVLMLGARSAATIGPNLGLIVSSGAALILQEFGNLGTIFFSIPVGVLIFGMGRSVVGAGFSISREGSIIVIGDMYGLDSDEGLGVMGGYITGTIFGTIICGICSSVLANTGWFHPYSLAMACGLAFGVAACAGGGDAISVYNREDGSGTRSAFLELLELEGADLTPSAGEFDSTSGVLGAVAEDVNGIGYISLGSLDDTVKAVTVEGVEASVANVLSGDYKISRPFELMYQQENYESNDLLRDFITYLESADAQEYIEGYGYISTASDAPAYVAPTEPFETTDLTIGGSTSVQPVDRRISGPVEFLIRNETVS